MAHSQKKNVSQDDNLRTVSKYQTVEASSDSSLKGKKSKRNNSNSRHTGTKKSVGNLANAIKKVEARRPNADKGGTSEVQGEKPKTTNSVIISPWETIRPFVERVTRKGYVGICKEFRDNPRPQFNKSDERFSEFLRQNRTEPAVNRYKDVGCLDISRVILQGKRNYIHANYVNTTVSKRFICTQAPMKSTVVDFWRMIAQEESTAIIMVCNYVEMDKPKCVQYMPKLGADIELGDIRVQWISSSHKRCRESPVQIEKTEVKITTNAGRSFNCTQFHWKDWPDRGVPEIPYLEPIQLLKEATSLGPNPVVVHCSAGVGRTGAIVLIQQALEMVEKKIPFRGFAKMLVRLRTQRFNSVQTEHQYLFVHFVMLKYFQKMKYFPPDYNEGVESFYREYHHQIQGFDK